MGFLALSHFFSLVAQRSQQIHQMEMVKKIGDTAVTIAMIGGVTHLAGKCIDCAGAKWKCNKTGSSSLPMRAG
ncbi:MAG: hypothetical protein E7200_00560 [Selenomonas ruminantium]|nr:hypothetical protein [Selenomonas ruminantium]